MKFGGTSVGDARAFGRVAELVRAESDSRPVVVVSAMSRFTDALLEAFERAAGGEGTSAVATLEEHFARHTEALSDLLAEGEGEAGGAFEEFREVIAHARGQIELA